MTDLQWLDEHYAKIWTCINGIQRDIQMAYYDGLRDMYERVTGLQLALGNDGKHYIMLDKVMEA